MIRTLPGCGHMGIIRGEPVVLAAKDESRAEALAHELGPLARAASVQDAIGGADVVAFEAWLTRPAWPALRTAQ